MKQLREIHNTDETLKKLLPPEKPQTGITYIPSQFSLPFVHKGKQYVFNTLTKQCVETALPTSVRAGEGYDELIIDRFLVPSGLDECTLYNSLSTIMRAYGRKKFISSYLIFPTLGCNARCVYCFEEGMKQVGMTVETVEDTLHFIQRDCRNKKARLCWFGGEPLMREDVIDRISEGLHDSGIDFSASIVSNGSLITQKTLEKMIGFWQISNIMISMDGSEDDYISRKRYVNYNDYYHKVINTVDRLSEAGITVDMRCNIDENNLNRVPILLSDLSEGITYKNNVYVYCVPLYQVQQGEHDVSIWERILPLNEFIREAGFFDMPYAHLDLVFREYYCMADRGGIAIAPDGRLYCCEHLEPRALIGNVVEGVVNGITRKEFSRTDRTREKCRKCVFLPQCTSFSSCPKYYTHCKEVFSLLSTDALRYMVDKADG